MGSCEASKTSLSLEGVEGLLKVLRASGLEFKVSGFGVAWEVMSFSGWGFLPL